jgi:hypothetical protein
MPPEAYRQHDCGISGQVHRPVMMLRNVHANYTMWTVQSLLRQKFTLRLLVDHIMLVCQPGPLDLVCKSLVVQGSRTTVWSIQTTVATLSAVAWAIGSGFRLRYHVHDDPKCLHAGDRQLW